MTVFYRLITPFFAGLAVLLATAGGTLGDTPAQSQPAKGGAAVGLLCTWVAFESEKETFVADPVKGSLYWVNQNQLMKVTQFNSGRMVAEGIRKRLKVGAQKYEDDVPVRMIFDRISGDFVVLQEAYEIQSAGSCQTRRSF